MIQVAGMTCSGCERKLQHMLSSVSGVHDVKTSLVLGQTEFDMDAGLLKNETVSSVERRTGFKCAPYQQGC